MEETTVRVFKYLCGLGLLLLIGLAAYLLLNPTLQDVCVKPGVNYTIGNDFTVFSNFKDQDTGYNMYCLKQNSDSTFKLCGYSDPALTVCLDYHYGADKYGQLRNMVTGELGNH